jgi:hypothetical protein
MLPPLLKRIRKQLRDKENAGKLSSREQVLLAELREVSDTLNEAQADSEEIVENVGKRIGRKYDPSVLGPAPGRCPLCGR